MDHTKILNYVIKGIKKGYPITELFKLISKKLKIPVSTLQTTFYNEIYPLNKEHIQYLQKTYKKVNTHNGIWTRDEDLTLIKIMAFATKHNKNKQKAVEFAAKKLNRSWKSVQGRWYNVLFKMDKVKSYINKIKEEAI